ncbi:MAG: glycoside hydrolase family 2 protein [Myxococcota bacterium]
MQIHGRESVSLNGRWRAIIDPYETGSLLFGQPTQQGFFRNHVAREPHERVEYDFDRSQLLHVPGDWNTQDERLFFYEGSVWYKRDLDAPPPAPGMRRFVYFGAANYEARAWLNGEPLGVHEGGFTPFWFEIGDRVKGERDFLVLKVDNRRRRDAVPALDTDWWNYGGLTRDVCMVDVPSTYVRDWFLQLDSGSCRRVAGWVQLDGAAPLPEVEVRVPELGLCVRSRPDARGRAEITFEADLELWAPARPRRYAVEIEAGADRVTDRIGFRTLEVRGDEILLNGEPIFLRGISIHAEAPLRGGRACGDTDARTLLGWARDLGCNLVRLAHYPHDEAMVRAADEMGLLCWCEIPVYWAIDWRNPETLECARVQLAEMIGRDHNRASVAL